MLVHNITCHVPPLQYNTTSSSIRDATCCDQRAWRDILCEPALRYIEQTLYSNTNLGVEIKALQSIDGIRIFCFIVMEKLLEALTEGWSWYYSLEVGEVQTLQQQQQNIKQDKVCQQDQQHQQQFTSSKIWTRNNKNNKIVKTLATNDTYLRVYHFCPEWELSLQRRQVGEKSVILKQHVQVSTATLMTKQ